MSDNAALKWLQRRAENSKKPAGPPATSKPTFGFQARPQDRTLLPAGVETTEMARESTASRLSKFSFRPSTPAPSQAICDENTASTNQSLPQHEKFNFKPSSQETLPAAKRVFNNEAPLTKTGQSKFGLPGLAPAAGPSVQQQQQPWRQEAPVPKKPRVDREETRSHPPPPSKYFGQQPRRRSPDREEPRSHPPPPPSKNFGQQPRRRSPPPPTSRNFGVKPQSLQHERSPPSNFAVKHQAQNQPKATTGPDDGPAFRTAHEQLILDDKAKGVHRNNSAGYGQSKRTLGVARSGSVSSGFKPPIPGQNEEEKVTTTSGNSETEKDERYKNIDDKMIELITNEIMDKGAPIHWDDIAGLNYVKTTVKEVVVFPLLRPDIFCGLRSPPKGILLFGPPGTGKTLIGKCIASQSKSTFFSISASSLTSKWVGEGEKMVRALFAVARVHQPSVVFIDEIDSLLSARSDNEHESSRRIKTEFLVQLDGCSTVGEERILIVGATNRPQDLDEAARRRLVKRLYVPLPDEPARKQIVQRLLSNQTSHDIGSTHLDTIGAQTEGYSGADMANLAKEAAMGPIRSLDYSKIDQIDAAEVRPISGDDFTDALRVVKASVSNQDLDMYLDWNEKFGCGK